MLHYFKFRQDLFAPAPAKDVYIKRPAGKGWPEHCPPIRAANSFGFDLLANFGVTFLRNRDGGTHGFRTRLVAVADRHSAADHHSVGVVLAQLEARNASYQTRPAARVLRAALVFVSLSRMSFDTQLSLSISQRCAVPWF